MLPELHSFHVIERRSKLLIAVTIVLLLICLYSLAQTWYEIDRKAGMGISAAAIRKENSFVKKDKITMNPVFSRQYTTGS